MKSKYYADNKRILFLSKTECAICGEDAKCCLEFHHIRDKLFNVSLAARYVPTNLLLKEIGKCICICKNCHSKIHSRLIKYESCSQSNKSPRRSTNSNGG